MGRSGSKPLACHGWRKALECLRSVDVLCGQAVKSLPALQRELDSAQEQGCNPKVRQQAGPRAHP